MKKGKVIQSDIKQIISQETGELISTERNLVTISKSDDKFLLVYIGSIFSVLQIKSGTHLRVMIAIFEYVEMNSNRVILIKSIKQKIADLLGLTLGTVTNSVSYLSKKNVLIREETSSYILNPNYFFRGSEIKRAKAIELVSRIIIDNSKE